MGTRKPSPKRIPLAWERQGDCIIVTSHKSNGAGYALIESEGRAIGIHRLVCERRYGRNAGVGKVAMHSCDNRKCINPDHLKFGTTSENMMDASAKGRLLFGENHRMAILNSEKAMQIFNSPDKWKDLAVRFGVEKTTIRLIKRKKAWKHIHE